MTSSTKVDDSVSIEKQETAKILIVDDLKENLFSLESILVCDNFALFSAESGKEALEILLKQEIALVIMDVQMPQMNGYEVAELMRSNNRTRHIPIIFVSGMEKDENHLFRGYESGAVDYLLKPIEPRILTSKTRFFVDLFYNRKELERTSTKLFASLRELSEKDEQLVRKQRLESMGRLVGGVAHEIRNPLSFMLSHMRRSLRSLDQYCDAHHVELQNEDFLEQLDVLTKIGKSLSISIDGGIRISKIVSDLSKFARTDNEERVFLQVNEIIGKVITLVKYDVENVARLETDLGTTELIYVDEGKMFQVFLNLVMNSIDSIEPGNRGQNFVKIKTWMDNETVNIEISDSGRGISQDDQGRIFDPFFSTKEVGEGTGLGLTTCYGIVSAHKGAIFVKSIENEGSSFTVAIPRCEKPNIQTDPK